MSTEADNWQCRDFVADPCGSAKCANCGKTRREHGAGPKHDPAILAECCKEASARLMRTVSIIQRAIAETPLANATSQVETK